MTTWIGRTLDAHCFECRQKLWVCKVTHEGRPAGEWVGCLLCDGTLADRELNPAAGHGSSSTSTKERTNQ